MVASGLTVIASDWAHESKHPTASKPRPRSLGPWERAKLLAKKVFKRCLPKFLSQEIQAYRKFGKKERLIYLRLRQMHRPWRD